MQTSPPSIPLPEHQRGSVLLVDDSAPLLFALGEALRSHLPALHVDTCESGMEALRRLRGTDFDVVITDLLMPTMDGFELLERLREAQSEAVVVLLSGRQDSEAMRRALRMGAYDFLVKPVEVELLCATTQRALEARFLRRKVADHQAWLAQQVRTLEQDLRARVADLEKANRTKDEFLATLSHELRTPLTAVVGWARLLREGRLDEVTRAQAIESIARNAAAQGQLIDDLLDISNIIGGRLRLHRERIAVQAIVLTAVDAVLPSAEEKGVAIDVDVATDVGLVDCDPDRMTQVCWNLLTNAVKFCERGGRVVCRAWPDDDEIHIEIADDGAGIAPELLPRVFERFTQGDGQSGTRRGLGLGLAIVKHLVVQHDGHIDIHSEGVGRGCRCHVTIPRGIAMADRSPNRKRPLLRSRPEVVPASLSSVRVLVVEDDPDAVEVVRVTLECAGADVTVATTGAEALRNFARVPPDVLLCDIGLPDIDGYEVMRTIRDREPQGAQTVASIALTAHARAEDRAKALAAGFQLHLPKPWPIELPAIVSDVLDRSRELGR